MIDRRRVPGLLFELKFPGGIVRALQLNGCLDLECVKRARLRGNAFLCGHLGGDGAFPAPATRSVDVGGFDGPRFADRKWRLNATSIIRRESPIAIFKGIPGTIESLVPHVRLAEKGELDTDL